MSWNRLVTTRGRPCSCTIHKKWGLWDGVAIKPKHHPEEDDEYWLAASSRPYDLLSEAIVDKLSEIVDPDLASRLEVLLTWLSADLMVRRWVHTNSCTGLGVSRLVRKWLLGGNLEFEIKNWRDRASRFPGWIMDESDIERRWADFKSEWARWRVRDSEASAPWAALLIGVMLSARRRGTGN